MARKQLGMVDLDLLNRVDQQAAVLGQTRRVFVERALEAALSEPRGASRAEQAGPVPVPSSEGVGPAASPRPSVVPAPDRSRPVGSQVPPEVVAVASGEMCNSCSKFGPPRAKPCRKCGSQG